MPTVEEIFNNTNVPTFYRDSHKGIERTLREVARWHYAHHMLKEHMLSHLYITTLDHDALVQERPSIDYRTGKATTVGKICKYNTGYSVLDVEIDDSLPQGVMLLTAAEAPIELSLIVRL